MAKPINDLLALVNSRGHEDEVIATGQKLASSSDAKPYDLAYIYEAMGYAYLNKNDAAKGIEYLQKSLGENALSNNDHYQEMLVVAKAQIAAGQNDAGLATLARVVTEPDRTSPNTTGCAVACSMPKRTISLRRRPCRRRWMDCLSPTWPCSRC